MIPRVMIALVLSALTGCTSPMPRQAEDGLLLRAILPPESLGRRMSLSQLVVGAFQGQSQTLRVEVEVMPTRLVMVGLTPLGVPLFTLVQASGGIEVDAPGAGRLPFDPRHVLSDFQIAFWPAKVLEQRFQSLGLRLADRPADGRRQVLGEDGEILVEVTYLDKASIGGDIVIEHFDQPYRLQIETLQVGRRS